MHVTWLSLLSLLPLVLGIEVPKTLTRTDYNCPRIWVRKEWRNLKKSEQKAYIKAVKAKRKRTSPDSPTIIDKMAQLHQRISDKIHYHACFLPWHRLFLVLHEELLQEEDMDIAQPYWQSTYDSQSPEDSPIFDEDAFGGNGKGPDRCVLDGSFSGMKLFYPKKACLSRDFDLKDIPTFPGSGYINSKMHSAKNFAQMHEFVEARVHADPHNFIGGNMLSMNSPNDPLFFCHHSYIDKLWADWQKKSPGRVKQYSGKNHDNSDASDSDALPYFDNYSISQTLNTKEDLCYIYKDLVPEGSPKLPPSKVVIRPDAEEEVEDWEEEERRLVRRRDKSISTIAIKGAIERSKICGVIVTPPVIVPVDDTVKVEPAPATVAELPKDEIPLLKLRMPYRVPDHWFKLNNIPLEVARRIHQESLNITMRINRIPGYVSPVALWNREDLLIKAAAKKVRLCAIVNGSLIEIQKHVDNAVIAASEIKDKLKASVVSDYLQKPIGEIVEQMVKVMGEPFYDESNPANPYFPRRPKEIGFGRGDFETKSPLEVVKEKLKKGLVLRASLQRLQISKKMQKKVDKWRNSYLKKYAHLRDSVVQKFNLSVGKSKASEPESNETEEA